MQFNVSDMNCGDCTVAIETSVKAADLTSSVACDLTHRRVKIDNALSPDQPAAAIKDADYDAAPVAA